MKPHEETWKRKGNDVVTSPRGRVLTVVRLYPNDDASLDLAAAAPEMARALLASGCVRMVGMPEEKWHTDHCWEKQECGRYTCLDSCDEARAALKKAGVIP